MIFAKRGDPSLLQYFRLIMDLEVSSIPVFRDDGGANLNRMLVQGVDDDWHEILIRSVLIGMHSSIGGSRRTGLGELGSSFLL